ERDQPPTRKRVKNRDGGRGVGTSRRPRRRERFTKRLRRLDRRRQTLGRTLFKETQDHGFERARNVRAQHTWRHDRRVYMLRNDSQRVVAGERQPASCQLIKQYPEGV